MITINWNISQSIFMRDSTGIEIKELIVHAVNPRQPEGFFLSERCIPLNTGEMLSNKLTEYFCAHIKKSLGDAATKAARFKALSENTPQEVSNLCQAVIREELDIVSASRNLAENLKIIIENDGRISPGNLIMCLYQAENYPDQRYIALMKMDPSDVFRQKIVTDEKGQFVTFEIEDSVMPTTQERLQKCAFIRAQAKDYDMMLLDRQAQKNVAQFFTRDFLQAEFALDDRERTSKFYRGVTNAMNDIRTELSPDQNRLITSMSRNAVRQKDVNIDNWVESLPLDEKHKKVFTQKLSGLTDREFLIDQAFYTKLGKRAKYSGDCGLSISIDLADKERIISEQAPKKDDEPWVITIQTMKWQQDL
jgi:37-kD nucleoid-associated bacterial protein